MTFDRRENEKSPYTHDVHSLHKKYLDTLKCEFLHNVANPPVYAKTPEDFDKVQTIGCGAFGTVFLVRDTITFEYYAMKAIEKAEVVKKRCLKQLHLEKKILQSTNFPFVLSIAYCCKDNLYVYFILPYEPGGELYSLIKKLGPFSEILMQFYAAQIVLALEYLHTCSVVHRDLKPENILICQSGYIRLGDFGFSKILKTRTWTLCGTPEYLAPEIIQSKGYSFSVDWWALGVLIFEMCAAYPPFYSSNPIKLYEKVLAGQFKTPECMTPVCKSLVKRLLEVDPTKRFGSLKSGILDIKSHHWFNEIEWQSILSQKLIPPYIPICKSSGDTTNFGTFSDTKLKKGSNCQFEEDFANF